MRLPPRATTALAAIAMAGMALLILASPSDYTLSVVFESDHQIDAAVAYLKRWTGSHPSDYDARLHTADLQVMTVRPQDALRTLEAMAVKWPHQPHVLQRLVDIEDSLLMVDETVAQLERLNKETPNQPALLRRLADYYRWKGATEPLLATLLKLVRISVSPDERLELVDILQANRRYDELIAWLAPNIARMPEQVELRIALYEAYSRSGRKKEAIAELRRILALAPERLELLRDLAEHLAEQGRFPEAVALYLERIGRNPPDVEAFRRELDDIYNAQIERLVLAGRRDDAEVLYRERIARAPLDLALRLELADLHGKSAMQVAIGELKDLLTRAPEHRDARRMLAQHFEWTNRLPEAIEQYKVLTRASGEDSDREVLVNLLLDSQRGDEALAVAQRLRPTAEHRYLVGLAAHAARQWPLAVRELVTWTQGHGDDRRALSALIEAAAENGQPDLALSALRRVYGPGAGARRTQRVRR